MSIIKKTFYTVALTTMFMPLLSHSEEVYPQRNIEITVPFGPGGVTDLTGRTYAKVMTESLQKTVYVANRQGAGATIGASHVARAKPDGYKILLGTNVTHAINPKLMKNITYDPLKDFEPIGMFGTNANVLLVKNDFPADTFEEFIDIVRGKGDQIDYASASIGSSAHMAGELLRQKVSGLKYQHIPFNGPAPAMTALISGDVDFLFFNIGASMGQINDGKVKPIAVTTLERTEELPQVPTINESGIKGTKNFEIIGWIAAFAPKNTPKKVVNRLNEALNQAQDNPELQKIMKANTVNLIKMSPSDITKFVEDEAHKWAKVIDEANIEQIE